MIKAEFSASLLQSSVSHDLQKSLYADLLLKKLIIINVVLLHIFMETMGTVISELFDK